MLQMVEQSQSKYRTDKLKGLLHIITVSKVKRTLKSLWFDTHQVTLLFNRIPHLESPLSFHMFSYSFLTKGTNVLWAATY